MIPSPLENPLPRPGLLVFSSAIERTQFLSVKEGSLNCSTTGHQLSDCTSFSCTKRRRRSCHVVISRDEKCGQMLAHLFSGHVSVNGLIFIFKF